MALSFTYNHVGEWRRRFLLQLRCVRAFTLKQNCFQLRWKSHLGRRWMHLLLLLDQTSFVHGNNFHWWNAKVVIFCLFTMRIIISYTFKSRYLLIDLNDPRAPSTDYRLFIDLTRWNNANCVLCFSWFRFGHQQSLGEGLLWALEGVPGAALRPRKMWNFHFVVSADRWVSFLL
jgi:hypothetical protein